MSTYDWLHDTDNAPPLDEDGTREDPGNRPQVPDDDDQRELHSGAGGGRGRIPTEHHEEHAIDDPVESVANESIVEDVRKFFGIHNRGKGFKSAEEIDPKSIRGYKDNIEQTFGSSDWLSKQSPAKGEIDVSGISETIDVNDPVSFLKAATAGMISILNAMGEASRKFQISIKPGMDLIGENCNLTDEAYETLKTQLDQAKPLSELYRGPAKISLPATTKVDTAAPVPMDKIPDIAKAVIEAMAGYTGTFTDYVDIGKSVNRALAGDFVDILYAGRDYGEGFNFKTKGSYKPETWAELGQRYARKVSTDSIPAYTAAHSQFTKIVHAAVLLMERSMKGSKVTVSNEGIFDVIRSIFGGKPKELDVDYIGNGIDKQFEQTLFNQEWLKKQKFTDGKVTIKFPKAGASGDYEKLCSQIEAELNATAAKNAKEVKAYYANTLPAFAAMDASIVNKPVEVIQKLRDLAVYDEMEFDVGWHDPKYITEQEVDVELPALDAAGIKKAAETILRLLEMITAYQNKCLENVPDAPKIKWRDLVSQIKDDSKRGLIQEYYEDLESINDYGIENFFQNNDVYWYTIENLTAGLMRWISKSVTGINFQG